MPVATDKALDGFGRYAGPATLILASLADGTKHGYALTKDIESFAGVRVAPGTLYEALARLQGQGLIEREPARRVGGPILLPPAGTSQDDLPKADRPAPPDLVRQAAEPRRDHRRLRAAGIRPRPRVRIGAS